MAGRLAGKVAMVTGGAQGLGAAMAAKFVAEGARVVVTDINAAGARATAAGLGAAAAARGHDVTSPDEWQAALAFATERFGGLHILVNNAGIGTGGTVESTSDDDWRRVHAVDLDSVFYGCKHALPLIVATCAADGGRGSILNISSIAGVIAAANMAAYNSAKAAVRHLSKSVALHCAKERYPVTCNSIHPVFIDTPILDNLVGGMRARGGACQARAPDPAGPRRRARRRRLGRGLPRQRRGEIRHRHRALYRRRHQRDVTLPPVTPQRLAFPAMLAGSVALAFGPWLVRLADVPAPASAFWRMALGTLPLFVLARAVAGPVARPRGAMLAAIAAAGGLFALDLALWHLGIVRTTLANAALVSNCASFLLPAYGFAVARTWPTRTAGVALLCAGAGIALLIGRSADVSATHLTGDLLCIGAGIAYTGYFIALDRVRATVAPLPLLAWATLFGALALLPLAAAGRFWPGDWTPLVLLALGSQVVGQGLVVFAVGYLPPLVIGLTLLVQPAIAATIGAWRFGEAPGAAELGGMALVALALVLVRLPGRRLAAVAENG